MWHLPRNITLDNHKIDSVENEEIKWLFITDLFFFLKAFITQSISWGDGFATLATFAMFDTFKTSNNLMIFCYPSEHQILPMNSLFHLTSSQA